MFAQPYQRYPKFSGSLCFFVGSCHLYIDLSCLTVLVLGMNKLDTERRAQVVAALVEGNSIRATVRMTGVAKNTIAKLLVELGAACSEYMNRTLVNLPSQRIQCDEIWSFVGCKEKI